MSISTDARRERNRHEARTYRARQRRGDRLLRVLARKDQLDQLEVLGHLDPNRRGDPIDEGEAVEAALVAYLEKNSVNFRKTP